MANQKLKVDDEFTEIGIKTVDDRYRITLGEVTKGISYPFTLEINTRVCTKTFHSCAI